MLVQGLGKVDGKCAAAGGQKEDSVETVEVSDGVWVEVW